MAKVVVIGAGPMGLMAGLRAAENGHQVTVLEVSAEPGGMCGHFDFGGLSLERFYHFITKTDEPTFELIRKLGLTDKLRWKDTSMGIFNQGHLFDWGDPVALFRFPHLSLLQKIRYGFFAFVCIRRDSWESLENKTAKTWITRWCGKRVYEILWSPLFDLKFGKYSDNISASWFWTRIRRLGRSRRHIFQEQLGYLEGGTLTLIAALMDSITKRDGSVRLSTPATRVAVADGKVTGVHTSTEFIEADYVISTIPTPYISRLVGDLPSDLKARYDSIKNIGCVCVIFKLNQMVSPHFWVNISEPDIGIPGIIEFQIFAPSMETKKLSMYLTT